MFNRKNPSMNQFKPMTPSKPIAPMNNYAKAAKPMSLSNNFAKPIPSMVNTKSSMNAMQSFKSPSLSKLPTKSMNTFSSASIPKYRGK